jgi:ATP-binding cassette subfamily C protein CydC
MKYPLLRLLKLALPFKGQIALAILLGVATIGSSIGLMGTSAYIISYAALHPSVAALEVAIVGVRFFGLARGIFRYLERCVSHTITFHLLARLRVWFYNALEPLAPARLLRYRSGDLFTRIVADIETLEHFYVRVIAPPCVAVLVTLGMWLFLRGFDSGLANTLLLFLLSAGVGLPLLTHHLTKKTGQRSITIRAELAVQVVDGVQGIAELVAFGQEERQQRRVATLHQELARLQRRVAWASGLSGALGNVTMNLATLAVLMVAIPLVASGQMAGISLAVVALASLASFEAVLPLPAAVQHLENSNEAAKRLFAVLDAQPEVIDPPQPVSRPQRASLSIEHLSFRYAPDEPLALRDISLTLPPGKTLALVGPSGAGKSTLAHLLLRFWEYQEGKILLGSHDLRQYGAETIRGMMAVVSQQTHLFNTTIRENLLLARPDASEAEMIAATKRAQLHDFIEQLPQGYDTWIGEQGLRLSGGERQRLAIARALLKDAPILILDEPTANLDAVTEREITRQVRMLMQARTTLLITHQLAGLEQVDEIVVLQAGSVIERGRHEELFQRDGLYRQMWKSQHLVYSPTADEQPLVLQRHR